MIMISLPWMKPAVNSITSVVFGCLPFPTPSNIFLSFPTCTVEVDKTLEHLENMDFVIFPNLDVLPHDSRLNFAEICRDLFR